MMGFTHTGLEVERHLGTSFDTPHKVIMKIIIILLTLTTVGFGIHGKVTFFDGTYVVGQVTKIDDSKVHIIPMGLDLVFKISIV